MIEIVAVALTVLLGILSAYLGSKWKRSLSILNSLSLVLHAFADIISEIRKAIEDNVITQQELVEINIKIEELLRTLCKLKDDVSMLSSVQMNLVGIADILKEAVARGKTQNRRGNPKNTRKRGRSRKSKR